MGRASIIPINHIGNIKMKISKPQDIERSAIRKLTLHIVPLMILLYFLAFLDRNNMAYAAKALEDNLGLTASAFGFASGIFFIGYFLFEIPSNAGTIKFGPRIWFARILISWGIFATLLGFVRTPLELYICRFMLGVCEAGFFPSVVYYFTVFFPEKYRTKILGMFIIVQPLSNAVGSPISGFILNIQHDWFGFAPWQLLFILEGLPPIVIGLLIPFLIKNSPKDVGYLNVEEKAWLMSNAGRSKSGSKITLGDFLKGIKTRNTCSTRCSTSAWCAAFMASAPGCRRSLPPFPAAISSALACWRSFPTAWPRCWCTRGACGPAKPKAWRVRRPQHGGRRYRPDGGGNVFKYDPLVALSFLCIAAIGIYTAVPPFYPCPPTFPPVRPRPPGWRWSAASAISAASSRLMRWAC